MDDQLNRALSNLSLDRKDAILAALRDIAADVTRERFTIIQQAWPQAQAALNVVAETKPPGSLQQIE